MALGTHESYRIPPGARVDLVVVSPENRAKAVLTAARAAHPGAKIFAYLNTMDVMLVRSPEPAGFWKTHEDWFLHDADGKRVQVRVKSYQGPMSRYGMNVAHEGWQSYLGQSAVDLLRIGYDGIQLDNVETDCSYRLRHVGSWISALPVEMTEERWYAGEEAMLGRIRAMADEAGFAGREIIFNHIRAGEPEISRRYLARVDGANAEDWLNLKVPTEGRWGWASRVDLIRGAARSGKRTNLLAIASVVSPEEALFTFASYLMAFEGDRNTFWYGKTYRAEEFPWYWFYDSDLGAPAGEQRLIEGSGVHARPFAKGLVLVNPQESQRTVDLEGEYLDEALDRVKRVTLRQKEGKILVVPSGEPVPRIALEAESCLQRSALWVEDNGKSALRRISGEAFSGGAAVELGDTRTTCTLEARLAPGRYRILVEGRGSGRGADAAVVGLGKDRRRVAFGFSNRQVFEIDLRERLEEVDLLGAEAGVIVDRVVAIRVSEPPS